MRKKSAFLSDFVLLYISFELVLFVKCLEYFLPVICLFCVIAETRQIREQHLTG